MISSSKPLPQEFRFGQSKPAARQESVEPFGLDRVDIQGSQVNSGGDLMPLCKGGATDVQSGGDLLPLCQGGATDVQSGRDLGPCMGGATDVNSGILDAMGCFR